MTLTQTIEITTTEDSIAALSPDLTSALGVLGNAPQEIAELSLATLAPNQRQQLKVAGVVDFEENDLEATTLKITPLGFQVIAACTAANA